MAGPLPTKGKRKPLVSTIIQFDQIQPTPDFCGSIYRLIRPSNSAAQLIDCVVAEVDSGARTRLHRHATGEELYFVFADSGIAHIGDQTQPVSVGSVIHIPADVPHMIENNGPAPLRLFVVNAPPYAPSNVVFEYDQT